MKLKKKKRLTIRDILGETDRYILDRISTEKRKQKFLDNLERIYNLSLENAKIDLYNALLPTIQVLNNIVEWLNNKLKKIFK